jgi:hypothetical protein
VKIQYFLAVIILCCSCFVFGQNPPYGIALDENKKEFLDKTEITVSEWYFYCGDLKNRYGDTSEIYQESLPDANLFKTFYGFSFLYATGQYTKDDIKYIRKQMDILPMSCLSQKQIAGFCTWRSDQVNEKNKLENLSYRVVYTLPTKEDYNKALSNAIISHQVSLSPVKAKNKFTGLTDNVPEYTNDGNVIIIGGNKNGVQTTNNITHPIGFRCKAVVVERGN